MQTQGRLKERPDIPVPSSTADVPSAVAIIVPPSPTPVVIPPRLIPVASSRRFVVSRRAAVAIVAGGSDGREGHHQLFRRSTNHSSKDRRAGTTHSSRREGPRCSRSSLRNVPARRSGCRLMARRGRKSKLVSSSWTCLTTRLCPASQPADVLSDRATSPPPAILQASRPRPSS